MMSNNYAGNGKYVHQRKVFLDVPMSLETFQELVSHFAKTNVKCTREVNAKFQVEVADFNGIWGENWHVVVLKNSTTVCRIIGSVNVHYRTKKVKLENSSVVRYFPSTFHSAFKDYKPKNF